eukprot:scaffold1741_cov262-Pinguiococcus_pyrenoidosus.AAC.37
MSSPGCTHRCHREYVKALAEAADHLYRRGVPVPAKVRNLSKTVQVMHEKFVSRNFEEAEDGFMNEIDEHEADENENVENEESADAPKRSLAKAKKRRRSEPSLAKPSAAAPKSSERKKRLKAHSSEHPFPKKEVASQRTQKVSCMEDDVPFPWHSRSTRGLMPWVTEATKENHGRAEFFVRQNQQHTR